MALCKEWLSMTHKERQEMIGELAIAIQRNSQCFRKAKDLMFFSKTKKIHHKSKIDLLNVDNNGN